MNIFSASRNSAIYLFAGYNSAISIMDCFLIANVLYQLPWDVADLESHKEVSKIHFFDHAIVTSCPNL